MTMDEGNRTPNSQQNQSGTSMNQSGQDSGQSFGQSGQDGDRNFSQAGSRLSRMNSGRPEEKPVNTQISMRRLSSAASTDGFFCSVIRRDSTPEAYCAARPSRYTAMLALRLRSSVTMLSPSKPRRSRNRMPCSAHRASKSAMVKKRTLGELYHW